MAEKNTPNRHLARAWALPVFLRPRAIWRFLRDRRASRASKIFFLLALLYTLLPADLVPDLLPVVGWLDDLGLLTAAVTWALHRVSVHERNHPEGEGMDGAVVEHG